MKLPKNKDRPSTDELADNLATSTPRQPFIPDCDMLSSGATLTNLAFSGRPNVAIPKSNYVCIIGGSGSSKTWTTFTWFAEAARNKNFDKYRFVFDNAENGAQWDTERFFGKDVYDRLEPPYKDVIGSETIEQFYYNLAINCDRGPCIYVLDSLDALNSDAANNKFAAELELYETGKGEVPGSMGMEKAKYNSANINRMVRYLRKNGSILVIICQTRSKFGGYAGQKTSGGGDALKFYAHIRLWMEVKGDITRTYMGKERNVGSKIQIDIHKNRVCGWEDRIQLDFLKNHGVCDVGSSIKWLLDEKHWKKPVAKDGEEKKKARKVSKDDEEESTKGPFEASEFDFIGKKETLVQKIQKECLEYELQQIVTKVWREIIENATPERKARYT